LLTRKRERLGRAVEYGTILDRLAQRLQGQEDAGALPCEDHGRRGMIAAIIGAFAMQQPAGEELALVRRYRDCVTQAAYYTGMGDEPIAEAARLAVHLCADTRLEVLLALVETKGEEAAQSRVQAWDRVLQDSAQGPVFRTRVCRRDIGCNAFLDAHGVAATGPYRATPEVVN